MGWTVGAGLTILLLLVFSATAVALAFLRFATRSVQTHPACIAAPAIAASFGFAVTAFLRFTMPATITFDILGLGTIIGVCTGCAIGCMPLKAR